MKHFAVLPTLVFLIICKLSDAQNGVIEGSICQANEHIGRCVTIEEYPQYQQTYSKLDRTVEDQQFLQSHYCGTSIDWKLLVCRPVRLNEPQCGKQLSDRLIDDGLSALYEFPWMALFQYSKPHNATGFHCGGALITKRYVLSAAHCFIGLHRGWRPIKVRLGEWDVESEVDCTGVEGEQECAPPVQEFDLEKIIPHEKFSVRSNAMAHDIALVRLSGDAQYSNYVKPICLPEPESVMSEQLYSGAFKVAGWGKTETDHYKRYTNLRAHDFLNCKEMYANLTRKRLEDGQICAKEDAKQDSCNGDSGAPLMKLTGNQARYFVAGIVSFGPKHCGEHLPGVYTKVKHYYPWIVRNVLESSK